MVEQRVVVRPRLGGRISTHVWRIPRQLHGAWNSSKTLLMRTLRKR